MPLSASAGLAMPAGSRVFIPSLVLPVLAFAVAPALGVHASPCPVNRQRPCVMLMRISSTANQAGSYTGILAG
jgi:hypothetical protein